MNRRENILKQLDTVDYIDFHIHLNEEDIPGLKENILYLANSVDRKSYNKALIIWEENKKVIPLPGVHPSKCAADDWPPALMEKLFSRCDLVGEIGLDFHWIKNRRTDARQRSVFRKQLTLAAKYNCIPSIHTKGAEKEILDLLGEYGVNRSIIHWYSGPADLIPHYLERGAWFTIGPDVLKESEIWKHIPTERMLPETDNPGGIPWITGKEAEPDDIILIYRRLSELLGCSESELIQKIKDNFKALLDVPSFVCSPVSVR